MMSNDVLISPRVCDFQGTSKDCGICNVESSKYTCPRCNLPYCSVSCFKDQRHSGCSEAFYKDWFVKELEQKRASDDEKREIMRMLQDLEEEDSEAPPLAERLEGLDLDSVDGDDLWKKLSKEEQQEFLNSLKNGQCEVETWTPWWTRVDKSLVTEIGASCDMDQTTSSKIGYKAAIPGPTMEVPELSQLLRGKKPSPLVRNNLASCLYSYAFFCRLYNGSIQDFPEEFTSFVIQSSPFLHKGTMQQTCEAALNASMEGCRNCSSQADRTMSVEVMLDVFNILIGPGRDAPCKYALAGLSELHRMCKSYRQKLKNRDKSVGPDSKVVFQVMKKVEFLASWVKSRAVELPMLAREIISIYQRQKAVLDEQKVIEANMHKLTPNQEPEKKPFIEEIK